VRVRTVIWHNGVVLLCAMLIAATATSSAPNVAAVRLPKPKVPP
jgi:hypothetical protein